MFFFPEGLRAVRSVWSNLGRYDDYPSQTGLRTTEFHRTFSGLGQRQMERKLAHLPTILWPSYVVAYFLAVIIKAQGLHRKRVKK